MNLQSPSLSYFYIALVTQCLHQKEATDFASFGTFLKARSLHSQVQIAIHTASMSPHVFIHRYQGFEVLTNRIFFYHSSESVEGELVILCTWLGALPKHIKKYIHLYRQIAPNASILLIESDVYGFTSSYNHQRCAIQPAVPILLDMLKNSLNLKILLHAFSNGGANSATHLLRTTQRTYLSPVSLHGLVLDSGPSRLRYWTTTKAVMSGLPNNPAAYLLGGMFVHGAMIVIQTHMALFGHESPADYQRRTMLDISIITNSCVTYLFSKADERCLWTDVKDHANDARGLGLQVEEILFDGSSHCNHFLQDPERYKTAVLRAWTSDCKNSFGHQQNSEGDAGKRECCKVKPKL